MLKNGRMGFDVDSLFCILFPYVVFSLLFFIALAIMALLVGEWVGKQKHLFVHCNYIILGGRNLPLFFLSAQMFLLLY